MFKPLNFMYFIKYLKFSCLYIKAAPKLHMYVHIHVRQGILECTYVQIYMYICVYAYIYRAIVMYG